MSGANAGAEPGATLVRPRLRILITNLCLNGRTGTEVYVRDLALQLNRLGHYPMVYTSALGVMADEISSAGIPVSDDIESLPDIPDVIHAHHLDETIIALLAYPGVPAVFVCHDLHAWHDKAPVHPRIRRYLAVSEALLRRLASDGVDPDNTQIFPNFVDLERFRPRPTLPSRPRRALVYGNEVPWGPYLSVLAEACRLLGIRLDGAGQIVGRTVADPERVLRDYDLVFAKGKSALEATAVGAAVIVYGVHGIGPMVSASELESIRRHNFGIKLMTDSHSVAILKERILEYDPVDAAAAQALVRRQAGLDTAVGQLVDIYAEVMSSRMRACSELVWEEVRSLMDYLPGFMSRSRQRTALLEAALASHAGRLGIMRGPFCLRARSAVGRIPVVGSALRRLRQALGSSRNVVRLSA